MTQESTWTIDVENLIQRLEILEKVPARLGVPSSEFYKIENLGNGKTRWSISSEATGLVIIQGKGEWPHPKSFHLDRRMMVPFVLAAKEIGRKAPFKFQLQGKQLLVWQGRRRAEFSATSQVEGYAGRSAGTLNDRMAVTEHVKSLIHCARNCASSDSLNPEMNCVYIQPTKRGVDILATNETIMYRARAKTQVVKEAVPFPTFLVTLLGSDDLKAIEWKRKLVALRYSGAEIWQSVSAKALRGFPKEMVEKYIAEGAKQPPAFVVASRKFSRVVGRLALYLQAVRRADWVLTVKGWKGKDRILLESQIANSKFKESLHVDGVLQENFEISWPLEMILPVYEFIAKKNKEIPLEVRLWRAKKASQKKRVSASYIKTGDIELVVPTSRVV